MKQVVRSQNKEIANPLADIGFFGKTRDEPAEDFRCDDDDDEHGSEEDNLTIADESLRKPKRKKKENKRKTQGKRRT